MFLVSMADIIGSYERLPNDAVRAWSKCRKQAQDVPKLPNQIKPVIQELPVLWIKDIEDKNCRLSSTLLCLIQSYGPIQTILFCD